MNKVLNRFLGIDKIADLKRALVIECETKKEPSLSSLQLIVAVGLALVPILLTLAATLAPELKNSGMLPTLAFGIATLLALLLRNRFGLTMRRTVDWRKSLRLTHTAFALGCIPAVIVLILSNTILSDKSGVVMKAISQGSSAENVSIASKIGFIIFAALWIAITEEVIFRGLLFSSLRRIKLFNTQFQKDCFALFCSAVIFGIAHWPTWGALPSIALIGLGTGFVLAYMATGEELLPVIVYHFAFDTLSFLVLWLLPS